jgi:hypothetical protein
VTAALFSVVLVVGASLRWAQLMAATVVVQGKIQGVGEVLNRSFQVFAAGRHSGSRGWRR